MFIFAIQYRLIVRSTRISATVIHVHFCAIFFYHSSQFVNYFITNRFDPSICSRNYLSISIGIENTIWSDPSGDEVFLNHHKNIPWISNTIKCVCVNRRIEDKFWILIEFHQNCGFQRMKADWHIHTVLLISRWHNERWKFSLEVLQQHCRIDLNPICSDIITVRQLISIEIKLRFIPSNYKLRNKNWTEK